MADRKYPFSVGNVSDEVEVEKAVAGLRLMAEYGKLAQEALDGLERNGCWNKKTPRLHGDGTRASPLVTMSKFPRFVPVGRDDMPDLSGFRVDIGRHEWGVVGGCSVEERQLHISGMGVQDTHGEMRPGPFMCHVGQVRLSLRRISIVDSRSNATYRLATRTKYVDAALKSLNDGIDSFLAECLCRRVVSARDNRYSQKGRDLLLLTKKHMVGEGHLRKLAEEIVRTLYTMEIMEG